MSTYTIKEVSDMFHIPASTLRYYEEIDLLTEVGRTASGQRIYSQSHVNRLKTISCFKQAGMTIAQLQKFFAYEQNEEEHIDDILTLLEEQKQSVSGQLLQLQRDYVHIQRKLHFYGDIKTAMESDRPHPRWEDYKKKLYSDRLQSK